MTATVSLLLLTVVLVDHPTVNVAWTSAPAEHLKSAATLNQISTISDSSQVRIVEHRGCLSTATGSQSAQNPLRPSVYTNGGVIQIDRTPETDIGSPAGSVELSDPSSTYGIQVNQRELLIADRDRLLRVSRSGKLIKIAGRRGFGPGEFSEIRSFCVLNRDTVAAIDVVGTLTLWTPTLDHIRTVTNRRHLLWSTCDGNGRMLSRSTPAALPLRPDGKHQTVDYHAVSSDGRVVGLYKGLPAVEMAGTLIWEPGIVWSGNELVVVSARKPELRWYRRNGTLRQIVRFTEPPTTITDAEWSEFQSRAIPAGSSAANRARVMALFGATPKASFPSHGRILVDPYRRVWVSDFASQSDWTVFGHDGSLVGRVQLPRQMTAAAPSLLSVGREHLQIRELDADGFVYIRLYRYRIVR